MTVQQGQFVDAIANDWIIEHWIEFIAMAKADIWPIRFVG